MTLQDRRAQLAERLTNYQRAQDEARSIFMQLSTQIDQVRGAIAVLDDLIAEEGNGHAIGEQGATAHDGRGLRAGKRGEEDPDRDESKPAP